MCWIALGIHASTRTLGIPLVAANSAASVAAGGVAVRRLRADLAARAAVLRVRVEADALALALAEPVVAEDAALSGFAAWRSIRCRAARGIAAAAIRRIRFGVDTRPAASGPGARARVLATAGDAQLVFRANVGGITPAAVCRIRLRIHARVAAFREAGVAAKAARSVGAGSDAVPGSFARPAALAAIGWVIRRIDAGAAAELEARSAVERAAPLLARGVTARGHRACIFACATMT